MMPDAYYLYNRKLFLCNRKTLPQFVEKVTRFPAGQKNIQKTG